MEHKQQTDQNPGLEPLSSLEENPSSIPLEENNPTSPQPAEEITELSPLPLSPESELVSSSPDAGDTAPPEDSPPEEQTLDSAIHPGESEEEQDEEDEPDEAEEERDYNSYSLEELTAMLETAVLEPDIQTVKSRIALIKMAFIHKKEELFAQTDPGEGEEPVVPDQEKYQVIENRFNELFSIYKANKHRYLADQEKQKKENLAKKLVILEKLRELIGSEETLKKTYDDFRALQEEWKEIGVVPRTEINDLWQNYHFLVEKFFEKVQLNKELKDLDLKKNLEAKILLCERTEELLLETSILKSFKLLQQYHNDWKEIGPVPMDKRDEIWDRFKNATDKINERRHEYYARIEEDQLKNLDTKTALCIQAEEIIAFSHTSVKEWQETTKKINELMNIWKQVGPVPKKNNADIWKRFKGLLDAYFAQKKEFFNKLKDQQMHNYNLKVDLCAQAEALKVQTEWKKITNEFIRLQEEWKKIGPVPRKYSDKLWKRFRMSCDEFFHAKTAYFASIHTHEDENLKQKEELLQQVKDHQFSDDKNKNLEDLKNFQRAWTQIGHVPIKERDRLQNEFRNLVNSHLDKLKISEVEMTKARYETRLESIRNDPDARRLISREREILSNSINTLRDEIILWENNIGFLAKSKNANILKMEFEKKIEKAKNDLKVMEAKLKILRQQ